MAGNLLSLSPPEGTVYVRVLAVSGSGMLGDSSGTVALQFGAAPNEGISRVSNYPNPFDARRGKTTINYTLNADSEVTIRIFNVFGGKVKEMHFSAASPGGRAGANDASWDGTDSEGRKVSKGMYLVVIEGAGSRITHMLGALH